jgi:hypothetical protein
LDIAGAWNPSSLFVMYGAILIAFHFAKMRLKALLGDVMRFPTLCQIDRRLVLGGTGVCSRLRLDRLLFWPGVGFSCHRWKASH